MSWPNPANEKGYERWEYYTEFVEAEVAYQPEALAQKFPGVALSKYAIQATLPRLNQLGEQGWELLHMEPLYVGKNQDVRFSDPSGSYTHTYFCVLKRPKRG
jgi:hypothetical protein